MLVDAIIHTVLIILAGLPATTLLSGTSFVTTAPAATVQPLPIVTPGQNIAAPPIQQSLPILIGFAYSRPYLPLRSSGLVGCVAAYIWTLGPMIVRSPIETVTVVREIQPATRFIVSPGATFNIVAPGPTPLPVPMVSCEGDRP